MASSSKVKFGVVITIALSLYIIQIVFGVMAQNSSDRSLFPNSLSEVSDAFRLYATPVNETYSIAGVIYFLQLVWLLYGLSTIFRNGTATEISSIKFYLCFIVSTIFVIGWLFSFTRKEVVPSFIVVLMNQLFLDLAFGLCCSDLYDYQQTHEIADDNKNDVWCQRILVQNGILFYVTYTTYITILSAVVLINQELGASDEASSLMALIVFGITAIVWFYSENSVLVKYTDYTVSAYLALIYIFSGIFAGAWGENSAVGGLSLALLIASILLLIVRVVLIGLKVTKRSSYETISYNKDSNTVRT